MDERIAPIENSQARLETQVAQIATDLGEFKREMKEEVRDLRSRIDRVGESLAGAKIWALFVDAALLGVLARGFHWI